MSVRVMSEVWKLDLPDSQKIVLLALADCANDEGHCWPSMRTLAAKCTKGERTVQGVIKLLVEAGHVTRREVVGKGCNYSIHPRNNCAPAENAPRREQHETPAEIAGHPRSGCGQTIKEPSRNHQNGGAKHSIPANWSLPPKSALPPKARALAEQWSDTSYETHGEAFVNFWQADGRKYKDWNLVWANRIVAINGQVMRDQKFGHSPKPEADAFAWSRPPKIHPPPKEEVWKPEPGEIERLKREAAQKLNANA